jgi:hypothetical protein
VILIICQLAAKNTKEVIMYYVSMYVQRLESEDTSPITSPRAPATLPKENLPKTQDRRLATNTWIIGTILGDGYIDPQGRLYIAHSVKQKEYFYWKFHKLKKMGALSEKFQPKVREQRHSKTGKIYQTLYVRTKSIFKKERALC